ncbi:MAG: hypothetical protein WD894_22830 [Pirellulales bacterium]
MLRSAQHGNGSGCAQHDNGKVVTARLDTAFFSQGKVMANEYDPYREKLVVETITVWPEEYDGWELADRLAAETKLQAEPEKATELEYVRQHTGFCRKLTVTADDLARIGMG